MHDKPATQSRTLAEGRFFCPSCKASTEYVEIGLSQAVNMDVWQWTIAKFRWEALRDYVECRQCKRRLEASVLQPDMQKLLSLVAEAALLRRRGVAYPAIRARLTTLGGSEHTADNAIMIALRE